MHAATITAARHRDGVVVRVEGPLDPASARDLIELVHRSIRPGGTVLRLEVDLRHMQSCSTAGVAALARCARLGARIPEGLSFRVGASTPPQGTDG